MAPGCAARPLMLDYCWPVSTTPRARVIHPLLSHTSTNSAVITLRLVSHSLHLCDPLPRPLTAPVKRRAEGGAPPTKRLRGASTVCHLTTSTREQGPAWWPTRHPPPSSPWPPWWPTRPRPAPAPRSQWWPTRKWLAKLQQAEGPVRNPKFVPATLNF